MTGSSRLIGQLAADGVGVIFITHRMDEIEEIGDRITVMRSGETVANLTRASWTTRELVRLMTGSDALVRRPPREGICRLPPRGARAQRFAG